MIGPNSKDLICKLLVKKNGVRAIERIMIIHRDTVSEVIEDLARHAREVTDYLDLYQSYTNFIRTPSALTIKTHKGIRNIEMTPCMAEGISKHPRTWKEFLMF